MSTSVITEGCCQVEQGVEIKGQSFWMEGWGGCRRDFETLRIKREGAKGLLVVLDSFFWCCPCHYFYLISILQFLGLASSSCRACFGLPPVSPYNPYLPKTQLSHSHSIISSFYFSSNTQSSTITFQLSTLKPRPCLRFYRAGEGEMRGVLVGLWGLWTLTFGCGFYRITSFLFCYHIACSHLISFCTFTLLLSAFE